MNVRFSSGSILLCPIVLVVPGVNLMVSMLWKGPVGGVQCLSSIPHR